MPQGFENSPAPQDQKEAVAFNLTPSETAKRKSAQQWSTIVQVKKAEQKYHSSGQIVTDLKAELKKDGFNVPDDMEFSSIDEVVDYVLEHTDFSFQPLTLGDIHIDQDAARMFKELGVEFVFDEASQKIDFKFPETVEFYDLDGNKTRLLNQTDATHFVDISISFSNVEKSFLVIIGMDDDTQVRHTVKYKVKEAATK